MTTAYRIEHSNPDIHCVEAYGHEHHPVFADRDAAEAFMARCIEAWPEDDTDTREMYSIVEYASLEDAIAEGYGRLIVTPGQALCFVKALSE